MAKKKSKASAEKEIRILLAKAKKSPEESYEFVRKAKREAMHYNIKFPLEIRKKFCSKCLVWFNSENKSTRIKRSFIVIKCLKCGCISRYKIP